MPALDVHKDPLLNALYRYFNIPFSSSIKTETNKLSEEFSEGGKLLDVGCGYGRISNNLSNQGYDIVGFDLSPLEIKSAKERGASVDYLVADMLDIPFRDESFKGAFCLLGAIQYLKSAYQRRKAIEEFYRVLIPGGKLVLSTSYSDRPIDQGSWVLLSEEFIRQPIEKAGFKISKYEEIFLGLLKIRYNWVVSEKV